MKEIVLYGAGNRCRILVELMKNSDYKIVAIVDSNNSRIGMMMDDYVIQSTEILQEYKHCCVCVSFYSTCVKENVWEKLLQIGFKKEAVFTFHDIVYDIYSSRIQVPVNKIWKKNKRIGFVGAWEMGLGGVESWLRNIIPAYASSNGNDFFFITKAGYDKDLKLDAEKIVNYCLAKPEYSLDNVQNSCDVILELLPCTLVFSRVDEMLLGACLVKEKYNGMLKIIMAVHGACDGIFKDVLSYKDYIDYYMCVSSGVVSELRKAGVKREDAACMTCPVSCARELCREYSMDKEKPIRLGYAGRIEILDKRADVLRDVIIELEKRGVNYVLDIAGSGSFWEEINNFVDNNSLRERVRLIGRVENEKRSDFWSCHDSALNTSDNEGRPLANMEAMANGVVPIVTQTIGVLDDVHNGINGFIVPINDVQGIVNRIQYMEEHRWLLREFGMRAHQDIFEKSSMEKHLAQWRKVFVKMEGSNDL